MPTQVLQRYCPTCAGRVLGVRQKPSHTLHLTLSILTGGLWAAVWFVTSINAITRPFLCQFCGAWTKPKALKPWQQPRKGRFGDSGWVVLSIDEHPDPDRHPSRQRHSFCPRIDGAARRRRHYRRVGTRSGDARESGSARSCKVVSDHEDDPGARAREGRRCR